MLIKVIHTFPMKVEGKKDEGEEENQRKREAERAPSKTERREEKDDRVKG